MAHRITGTCWNVTYEGNTITVTVIDSAGDGYNLSEEAMNTLTCVDFISSSSWIYLLMRAVATARLNLWAWSMERAFRSTSRFVG